MINSETSAIIGRKRRTKTKKETTTMNEKTTQTNKHMSNTNSNFIKDIIRRTLSDFKKNLYLVKL
jgi:ribosomal protein L13